MVWVYFEGNTALRPPSGRTGDRGQRLQDPPSLPGAQGSRVPHGEVITCGHTPHYTGRPYGLQRPRPAGGVALSQAPPRPPAEPLPPAAGRVGSPEG